MASGVQSSLYNKMGKQIINETNISNFLILSLPFCLRLSYVHTEHTHTQPRRCSCSHKSIPARAEFFSSHPYFQSCEHAPDNLLFIHNTIYKLTEETNEKKNHRNEIQS